MKIKDQIKELRSKTAGELQNAASELRDTIAKSKIEARLGDVAKVKSMRPLRKRLARIYTILGLSQVQKTVASNESGGVKSTKKKESK